MRCIGGLFHGDGSVPQDIAAGGPYRKRRVITHKKMKAGPNFAICLALGIAFGIAMHNLGVGLAFGLVVGVALDNKAKNNKGDKDAPQV